MKEKHKIAVLGIGNLLCRDDGIGIHVIQAMRNRGKYNDIDLIDGGTSPDLLSLLDESIEKVVIIDALKGGGHPGSIYKLDIHDENISDGCPPSVHGLGVLDSLLMMKKLNMRRPSVAIVGIEPADISYGLTLTPPVEAAIPSIINAVEGKIQSSS